MFRLMLGFFAGLALGLNCSKLAFKGSKTLRQLADRLDRLALERARTQAVAVEGEKQAAFKPAA